jgi:hypothetical protein
MHRITRTIVVILALAAGHADVTAAHPATERACGLITDSDGARIGSSSSAEASPVAR